MAAALLGASDSAALDEKAAAGVRRHRRHASALSSHTAWPYVAAAGGALILLAGLLALRYGRPGPRCPAATSATARPARAAAPPAVDPDRPEDLWKALDRGEDPTRHPRA